MRENKFRFWDKETNTMMGPNLDPERFQIVSYDGLALIDTEREDEDGYPYQMDVVFLEYTGLPDRNGKEIYEGDILSWKNYNDVEFLGVVNSRPGVTYINWKKPSEYPSYIFEAGVGKMEIRGNIYEHPHLLKE